MTITASRLRGDVYNILDQVLETGVPLKVIRKGKVLEIVPERPRAKPGRRKSRKRAMIGDPEDFVHLDRLPEWSEAK